MISIDRYCLHTAEQSRGETFDYLLSKLKNLVKKTQKAKRLASHEYREWLSQYNVCAICLHLTQLLM